MVVNCEEVEVDGYFWVIFEVKIMEGSVVVFGSNLVIFIFEIILLGKIDLEEGIKNQLFEGIEEKLLLFDLSCVIKEVKIIV